jgi:hypothetical protein
MKYELKSKKVLNILFQQINEKIQVHLKKYLELNNKIKNE